MAQSRRFKYLLNRLDRLKSELLPAPNSTGNYSPAEQDRIRAFRLLAHAECEVFFEESVKSIVTKAERRYTSSNRARPVLKALVRAYCRDRQATDLRDKYTHAIRAYNETVRKNHGIKERNICALILPLGIDESYLDHTWLRSMERFGEERGKVAHGSSVSVQTVLDPANELQLINQVTTGISQLDSILKRIQ